MPATTALELAKSYASNFLKSKGIAITPKETLDDAITMARAYVSNRFPWTFSRFRETIALVAADITNGYFIPSNKWAGEIGIVQTLPAESAGGLTYMAPKEFEKRKVLDSGTDSSSQGYTIYNERRIALWPNPVAGSAYLIIGQLDLMDTEDELPMRFGAVMGSLALFFAGGPPPNDRVTWMMVAENQLKDLMGRDRPGSRGKILTLPPEESAFIFENE